MSNLGSVVMKKGKRKFKYCIDKQLFCQYNHNTQRFGSMKQGRANINQLRNKVKQLIKIDFGLKLCYN